MKTNLNTKIREFVKDESGQTTTEYILILAVIITIFMQFKKKLVGLVNKVFGEVDQATEGGLIDKEG